MVILIGGTGWEAKSRGKIGSSAGGYWLGVLVSACGPLHLAVGAASHHGGGFPKGNIVRGLPLSTRIC